MPEHIDPTRVQDFKVTSVPMKGRTVSGYGGDIPTRYLLRYGSQWYRVKVMQYGNGGGTPFITVKGEDTFLDSWTVSVLESAEAI